MKLLAYRIFDPAKIEPKPAAAAETPPDLAPQIAQRAYERYEARRQGTQDWAQAEQKIRIEQSHP